MVMDNFRCATRDIKEPLNLYLKKGLLVSFFGIFLPMRNVDLLKTIISFLSDIILHGNQFFIKKRSQLLIVSMRNVLTVVFKARVLVHEREVRLKNLARSLCQSSPWQPFFFLGDQAESGR